MERSATTAVLTLHDYWRPVNARVLAVGLAVLGIPLYKRHMDNILQRAILDREALERRLHRLVTELEQVRADIARQTAFVELYERYSGSKAPTSGPLSKLPPTTRDRGIKAATKGALLESSAIAAIERAGHPMTIQALVTALTANGIEIGGERPATNLAGVLSRSARVKYTHGVGWRVIGEDTSDAPSSGEMEGDAPTDDKASSSGSGLFNE